MIQNRVFSRWHFLIQPCAERGNPAAMTRICLHFVKVKAAIHAGSLLMGCRFQAFTLFVNGYVSLLLYMKGMFATIYRQLGTDFRCAGCYVLAIATLTLGVIAVGLMFVVHRFWCLLTPWSVHYLLVSLLGCCRNRFYAEPGPESYATVFDVAEGAAYEHPLMKIKVWLSSQWVVSLSGLLCSWTGSRV